MPLRAMLHFALDARRFTRRQRTHAERRLLRC